jgi:hypothetical protein
VAILMAVASLVATAVRPLPMPSDPG